MSNRHIMTKSRQITLATLVLAVGAAAYLNFSMSRAAPTAAEPIEPIAAEEGAVLETAVQADSVPETTAVFDALAGESAVPVTLEEDVADKNYGEAQLVSVSKDTGTEFFDAARLSRSKARDEALEALKKALKNAALSEEEKSRLTGELSSRLNNVTMETSLETMIKAKGFADCVVNIDGSRANVTVMTANNALTAAEVAQIRDALLNRCHGMTAQDITIVEVK